MNADGYRIQTIFACGGDTKNPVFVREHADATGCRVVLPAEPEAVLLGAAILGAVASGDRPSVLAAMAAMNRAGRTIEPAARRRGAVLRREVPRLPPDARRPARLPGDDGGGVTMRGFPVVLEIPVQWGDMDALGHVNNARYFTWFESARIAYIQRIGGGVGVAAEVGPILASVTCDYLRPIAFPATARVGARVSEVGNSSLRMEYGVERADAPDEPCARGTSVIVVVRYATLEKVRVPDEARAAIAALEKGS